MDALGTVVAAGIATVASTFLQFLLDRRGRGLDLETEFRHDQRKALRELIGRYRGGLLEDAVSWNYRMINLFRHHEKGWLDVAGSYGGEHYYIQSSVYRLLSLLTLAQQFENEEIYIDARYVEDTELEFVKFVKAFHWVMSDTLLFEGLGYDATHERDHFNSDNLRAICEATLDNGRVPSFKAFQTSLEGAASPYLDKVFAFFDGLRRGESRLRWDRLICLYILTSAFVATYGYDWQTKSSEEFAMSAKQQIEHPEVLDNLAAWLPRLGLAQQKCLLQVFREPDTPSPEERPGPKRT